jgi:hypothetical protein
MRSDKIESLRKRASCALASLNVLFEVPDNGQNRIVDIDRHDFVLLLKRVLASILKDLEAVYGNDAVAARFYEVVDNASDSVDYINTMAVYCLKNSFQGYIESAFLDITAMEDDFFSALNSPDMALRTLSRYKMAHADRLCKACGTLIPDFLNQLELTAGGGDEGISRINPCCYDLICEAKGFGLPDGEVPDKQLDALRELAYTADPFRIGRTFRYVDGEFHRVELNSIRPVDKFYGYFNIKELFKKHFSAFAKGESNIPLLITSLPGLGKTHFSIAYTLAFPELTLILPEPEDLEKNLVRLIQRLAKRRSHKFVLFFDDVDARNINWYYFRTNVGGSFVLPDNVIIVIASNFDFPANICSRGRELTFPLFDDEACSGMIYDYLKSLKMRNPSRDLISVMAADYQEEFGQKVYAELSPRTLVRYLEIYDRSPAKRKKMLELSRSEVITRPDPQLFHYFNVKLIKQLYGDAGMEELRNRALRGSGISSINDDDF